MGSASFIVKLPLPIMVSNKLIPFILVRCLFSMLSFHLVMGGNIGLGASLTPDLSSKWVSDNAVFALGFQAAGPSLFTLTIFYNNLPNKTVVWTASWGQSVTSNASLVLGHDGDLVLSDNSVQIWHTNTGNAISSVVVGAQVSDDGALLLVNQSSKPVWQSSDYLTDTLLPGQPMVSPAKLTAANGRYYLSMQTDSNLVLYFCGFGSDYAYWSSQTANVTAQQPGNGVITTALLNTSGSFWLEMGSSTNTHMIYEGNTQTPSVLMRLQLTTSGVAVIFVWAHDTQSWTSQFQFPETPCTVPQICGPYGICKPCADGLHYSCECPLGFQYMNNLSRDTGCIPNVKIDCYSGTRLLRLNATQFSAQSNFRQTTISEQACKQDCEQTCNCMAAEFHGSSSQCSLKTVGMIHNGQYTSDQTIRTYLKVSASESAADSDSFLVNTQPPTSTPGSDQHITSAVSNIAGVAGAFVFLAVLTLGNLVCCYNIHRKRQRWYQQQVSQGSADTMATNDANLGGLVKFSFRELQAATNRFREKLGKGGFGSVYKGILAGGVKVAVKQLESLNHGLKQFKAEVETIGAIHHIHLVRLRGYCGEGVHKLLVYEFLANGSLERYLFPSAHEKSQPEGTTNPDSLDWNTRFAVAHGTAKAISYLHEECAPSIIHCDIKPENILLDSNFCPKVSDFGLAKLLCGDNMGSITDIRGTAGYMAPEWMSSKQITVKIDVYSYGIVLLEIMSGRRNLDLEQRESRIVYMEWAYKELSRGNLVVMLDPNLRGKADMQEVERMAKVAFWCIQKDPSARPSMHRVIQMLDGTIVVPIPPPPLMDLH